MRSFCVLLGLGIALTTTAVFAQDAAWKHSGSFFLLTTPEGADLPTTAVERDFPVLVRLRQEFFDFRQAQPHGEDLRCTNAAGKPLALEIESWDAQHGQANVWIRIPQITGNARQELKLHWGNPQATSESQSKSVFNDKNNFVTVWHLGEQIVDATGTLTAKDTGTAVTAGVIGQGRHFALKQGLFCGEKLTTLPSESQPHSTSLWFRAENANPTIIGWGNEGGGRGSKVRMKLRSPPHIHIDSDFSDVGGESRLPLYEWIHVVHTYENDTGKIYINGKLDGTAKPHLNIRTPARMWIGGWYHNYDFVGDLDEVRISSAARSADWIKLEYENQKPLQTLVGPLVRSGKSLTVVQQAVTVAEGQTTTIKADATGAQKIYWSLVKNGQDSLVAVDTLAYTFSAGRVVGDQTCQLRVKAIFPDSVKTETVTVKIQERIPEPEFTLTASTTWNGRETLVVTPRVSNRDALAAQKAEQLNYRWHTDGIAVIKEVAPGKLILKRAQNSGVLTVSLALDNGGTTITRSATIRVTEPPSDSWVARTPDADEKPEEGQFYPRDGQNEGTLYYCGKLAEKTSAVFLKVYADDKLYRREQQPLAADQTYRLAVKLKPGLIKYRVEFGTVAGQQETVLDRVGNLICGDAFLIDGQSNAEATDVGKDDPPFTSEWIRSFGSMAGNPEQARLKRWGPAVCRDRQGGKLQIGYWGWQLAHQLVEKQQVPVCILNGAVGGTRIDVHQRNEADPTDATTIYGRLLWRVQQARLTHGIRAILWHQGENDQGADGPTGGFGWETYHQYFQDMAAGWKTDYPNVQRYYVFQIWPKACSMGVNGSDNVLREKQRTLTQYFSRLSVMSTLGVKPPGGCHFPPDGYTQFADLICPVMERDLYGKKFAAPVTAPNLERAYYADSARTEVVLQFDQLMTWNERLPNQFYVDGRNEAVVSGSAAGQQIRLKLADGKSGERISYLDSKAWSQESLLYGANGIAALTFCDIALGKAESPSK